MAGDGQALPSSRWYRSMLRGCLERVGCERALEAVGAYVRGEKVDEIVERLGVPRHCLYAFLYAAGVPLRNPEVRPSGGYRRVDGREEAAILALRERGLSAKRIAELLGRSEQTVLRVLRRHGVA